MADKVLTVQKQKRLALVATTLASADFMITSPLMDSVYSRKLPDFDEYRERMKGISFAGEK